MLVLSVHFDLIESLESRYSGKSYSLAEQYQRPKVYWVFSDWLREFSKMHSVDIP